MKTFVEAKTVEYSKNQQIHEKLRNYRIALQQKLIESKKTQADYRTNNSLESTVSNKSRNTTSSLGGQDDTDIFNRTGNSSVHQRSANSSDVVDASEFFNKSYQT